MNAKGIGDTGSGVSHGDLSLAGLAVANLFPYKEVLLEALSFAEERRGSMPITTYVGVEGRDTKVKPSPVPNILTQRVHYEFKEKSDFEFVAGRFPF